MVLTNHTNKWMDGCTDGRTDNTNPRVTLQLKTHHELSKIETVDQATPKLFH